MKPELYLSDALGAVGKPMFRVHTAGSVGGTTGIVGRLARAGGQAQDACWPSPSRSSPRATPSSPSAAARAPRSAPAARSPRSSAPTSTAAAPPSTSGGRSRSRTGSNALKNPYAHLKIEDISIEKVKESPMMWEPDPLPRVVPVVRRRLRGGPHRRGRRQGGRGRRSAAGVDPRHRRRAREPPSFPGRDPVRPQARLHDCADDVYAQAGITDPRRADRHGRAVRAVLLARGDLARGPRHRRARARAGR